MKLEEMDKKSSELKLIILRKGQIVQAIDSVLEDKNTKGFTIIFVNQRGIYVKTSALLGFLNEQAKHLLEDISDIEDELG